MDTTQALPPCEILRREIRIRNPFKVERLPFLSRLHATAFLPSQRFYLPSQMNVLAVPRERLDELRRRIERGAAP